jgi:hypothetical protein
MVRVFTFIDNCVWIFWFITKNIENPKKIQNKFQQITKHVFWQDNILHMWLAPKARHFEPIEHNYFCQMVKILNPLLCNPFFQNFKTLKFVWLGFHQVHPMNIYFHKWGHVFVVQKFEINCMTLCIFFYSFF